MAKDALDAYIELTPSKKMRASFAGESQGAVRSKDRTVASIEISFFRVGSAQSLAKAKALRDRDKLDKGKQEELEEKEEDGEVRIARERPSVRTGDTSQDYRFQITKQVERSSPFLMQAYFSNSYKPKRREYNSFSEAKVTVRKMGHQRQSPHGVSRNHVSRRLCRRLRIRDPRHRSAGRDRRILLPNLRNQIHFAGDDRRNPLGQQQHQGLGFQGPARNHLLAEC